MSAKDGDSKLNILAFACGDELGMLVQRIQIVFGFFVVEERSNVAVHICMHLINKREQNRIISSFIELNLFSPMPVTFIRSSIVLKYPFSSRYFIIFLESA